MKRFLVSIALLFFVTGCGGGKIQLGGTVTFEDDTPLSKGSVVFSTDTYKGGGNIDSNGKYVVGSIDVKDGLPKGTYKVFISGATEEITVRGSLSEYSLIDPKYASYNSTPLTCEIPAPKNTFDIKVPKNPNPKP